MKKGVLFKTFRVIVVLAVSMVIAGVLMKMRPRAQREQPPDTGRLVEVVAAREEQLNMVLEAYGTVRPREELKLVAEVPGRVVEMHPLFKEGGYVEKGCRLATIDPAAYELEVERQKVQMAQIRAEMMRLEQEVRNLKASIGISRADVTLSKDEFVRFESLSDRKVAAETSKDKAEQRYLASLERMQGLENQLALTGPMMTQLEARLKMAEVMRSQAELNLAHTLIAAPFSGWVLSKDAEVGQYVNLAQMIGSIYRDGAYEVEVRIPAADLAWLPDRFDPDDGPRATIAFSGGASQRSWQGRVSRAKAGMDEKTRTLPLIVDVDLPTDGDLDRGTSQLKPGMFVTVQIQGRQVPRVFVVARHLIHEGDTVHIARDDRLKVVPVRILRRFKDSVYVADGLTSGDLIVKTPLNMAVDGTKIRYAN